MIRVALLFVSLLAGCSLDGPLLPFRSEVDGDRPLQLQATPKLMAWAADSPMGARARLLESALPQASALWNPRAAGPVQTIPVDFDDSTDGACAKNNFMLFSIPGQAAIWVCPRWIFCVHEHDSTLYGAQGCLLHLAHELGHVLGARQHAQQGDRALHGGGSVMCSWSSDCADPKLTDFTNEDVALICGDGGHGGRCAP